MAKTTENVAALQSKLTLDTVFDMMGKGDFMLEIAIVEDEEKEALRLGGFLDRFSEETGIQLNQIGRAHV